jgi:DNA-binding transcriptional regulator YiaG
MELLERRAATVFLKELDSVSGAELKFARKAIGLRQIDLARALSVEPETVCHWEASERISRTTQLAVAQLVDLYTTDRKQFDLLTSREMPPESRRRAV